jgi:hypothetical protein
LNIRITLVWADIWKAENPIEVTEEADKTLRDFLTYRKTLLAEHSHDNAHLLTFVGGGKGELIREWSILGTSNLVLSLERLIR